jgi:hypothetical protein
MTDQENESVRPKMRVIRWVDQRLTLGPFCWRCWFAERQEGATLRVAWRVARGDR